ncbi:tetratricopeptide repeat protein [Halomonas salifodinae]|uniref:tetratricopeptide repeat protein n=1 Tax=Halomonas salifodinae TaxID=438745 RepID=UPI003D15E8CE
MAGEGACDHDLRGGLEQHPNDPALLNSRAQLLSSLGRYGEARSPSSTVATRFSPEIGLQAHRIQ